MHDHDVYLSYNYILFSLFKSFYIIQVSICSSNWPTELVWFELELKLYGWLLLPCWFLFIEVEVGGLYFGKLTREDKLDSPQDNNFKTVDNFGCFGNIWDSKIAELTWWAIRSRWDWDNSWRIWGGASIAWAKLEVELSSLLKANNVKVNSSEGNNEGMEVAKCESVSLANDKAL